MFFIQLKLIGEMNQVQAHMAAHKQWIKESIDAGIILCVGNLTATKGGGILAHSLSLPEMEEHLEKDPFVLHKLVTVDIVEFTPAQAHEKLSWFVEG